VDFVQKFFPVQHYFAKKWIFSWKIVKSWISCNIFQNATLFYNNTVMNLWNLWKVYLIAKIPFIWTKTRKNLVTICNKENNTPTYVPMNTTLQKQVCNIAPFCRICTHIWISDKIREKYTIVANVHILVGSHLWFQINYMRVL
jgi:hypothetical protein